MRVTGAVIALTAAITWAADRLGWLTDPLAGIEESMVAHPWWVVAALAVLAAVAWARARVDGVGRPGSATGFGDRGDSAVRAAGMSTLATPPAVAVPDRVPDAGGTGSPGNRLAVVGLLASLVAVAVIKLTPDGTGWAWADPVAGLR